MKWRLCRQKQLQNQQQHGMTMHLSEKRSAAFHQKRIADTFEMGSHLVLPLPLVNGDTFYFFFYSRRPDAYNDEHTALFNRLEKLLTAGIENILV